MVKDAKYLPPEIISQLLIKEMNLPPELLCILSEWLDVTSLLSFILTCELHRYLLDSELKKKQVIKFENRLQIKPLERIHRELIRRIIIEWRQGNNDTSISYIIDRFKNTMYFISTNKNTVEEVKENPDIIFLDSYHFHNDFNKIADKKYLRLNSSDIDWRLPTYVDSYDRQINLLEIQRIDSIPYKCYGMMDNKGKISFITHDDAITVRMCLNYLPIIAVIDLYKIILGNFESLNHMEENRNYMIEFLYNHDKYGTMYQNVINISQWSIEILFHHYELISRKNFSKKYCINLIKNKLIEKEILWPYWI